VTIYSSLVASATRVATATSVIRTRRNDTQRIELNGGTPLELYTRIEHVIGRLEQTADELERLMETSA
jgi:hypothetical protein